MDISGGGTVLFADAPTVFDMGGDSMTLGGSVGVGISPAHDYTNSTDRFGRVTTTRTPGLQCGGQFTGPIPAEAHLTYGTTKVIHLDPAAFLTSLLGSHSDSGGGF